MNPQFAHHAGTDPGEDQVLPCPHALIASTLALMTTWADPAPGCALDVLSLRSLLARKLAANLSSLATHPALSPAMRQVMRQVRDRWQGLAGAVGPVPAATTRRAHQVQPDGQGHPDQPGQARPQRLH